MKAQHEQLKKLAAALLGQINALDHTEPLKLGQAQELIARTGGYKTWSALLASLNPQPPKAQPAHAPAQLSVRAVRPEAAARLQQLAENAAPDGFIRAVIEVDLSFVVPLELSRNEFLTMDDDDLRKHAAPIVRESIDNLGLEDSLVFKDVIEAECQGVNLLDKADVVEHAASCEPKAFRTAQATAERRKCINHYSCVCGHQWADEWDCEVDDDCPVCGTSMTPFYTDDGSMPDLDEVAQWVKETQHVEFAAEPGLNKRQWINAFIEANRR